MIFEQPRYFIAFIFAVEGESIHQRMNDLDLGPGLDRRDDEDPLGEGLEEIDYNSLDVDSDSLDLLRV